jgi:hypothetical protein
MPNDQELKEFLAALDAVCTIALAAGLKNTEIAGALLARCQQIYLADDQYDLDGLSRLLTEASSWIEQRPRWNPE